MLTITNTLIQPIHEQKHKSPLLTKLPKKSFITKNDVIKKNIHVNTNTISTLTNNEKDDYYLKAGPYQDIAFDTNATNVAIVTAGGLCPGINNVIYDLVHTLDKLYGIKNIYGIQNGFKGVYTYNMIELSTESIEGIQYENGSYLGTSRGELQADTIIEYLKMRNIHQLYIVGGDGTHRGSNELAKLTKNDISIACLPKTIDNDLPIIDKSFGFDTAVEEAKKCVISAHSEAKCTENSIGIVKLMGRHCGWIALYASLTSYNVDVCLIPEYPADIEKVEQYVKEVTSKKNYCMIVVAEGVGKKYTDDIGLYLKALFSKQGYCVKYIDPTYMVRSIPANAHDVIYCKLLAQSAVHACMNGYSGFTVGKINNKMCIVPLKEIVENTNDVNKKDNMWIRLLQSNLQPTF